MASISDHQAQLALLRRDPLKHAVILKYLLSTPGAVLHQTARGRRSASLLLLDPRRTNYDRRTYPEATASVLLASDDPALTRELMAHVPAGERIVFRLPGEADRAVVAERFALERRNAFLSFTGAGSGGQIDGATIGTDAAAAPYALFAQQDHEEAWIAPMLQAGRAFTSVVRDGGTPVAACFAYEIDTAIWEIGGVYCLPEHRGRGHARRAVQAALGELARRGRLSRYQAAEANTPSIRLARSLGMTQFLTLTHFVSR